jgi:hypothetical protein
MSPRGDDVVLEPAFIPTASQRKVRFEKDASLYAELDDSGATWSHWKWALALISGLAILLCVERSRLHSVQLNAGAMNAGSILLELSESNQAAATPTTTLLKDKPLADKRKFQYATLENGLKVINVLDEQARKSAFAVSVQAGSFDDTLQLPGLAHFCEHMLFLGTKKVPQTNWL